MVEDNIEGARYVGSLPKTPDQEIRTSAPSDTDSAPLLSGAAANGTRKLVENTELFEFRFSGMNKQETDRLTLYFKKLPDAFPNYYSSNIFLSHKYPVQFFLDGREFSEIQGYPTANTVDINNYRYGYLTIGIAKNKTIRGEAQASLRYPKTMLSGLESISQYNNDELGFVYNADRNGWLVFHYPYDKKWRLSVDGKEKPLVRANTSFMASPITKGIHRISLKYWPNTGLRAYLAISYLIMTGTLLALFFYFLQTRWSPLSRSEGLENQGF